MYYAYILENQEKISSYSNYQEFNKMIDMKNMKIRSLLFLTNEMM